MSSLVTMSHHTKSQGLWLWDSRSQSYCWPAGRWGQIWTAGHRARGPGASTSPLVGRAGSQHLWLWGFGNPRVDVGLLVGTAEA